LPKHYQLKRFNKRTKVDQKEHILKELNVTKIYNEIIFDVLSNVIDGNDVAPVRNEL
jgi:hypothetical protein